MSVGDVFAPLFRDQIASVVTRWDHVVGVYDAVVFWTLPH